MSFRFTRRIQLLPGIALNLSKSGASISLGPKGAKVTIGTKGIRGTLGLPGTGLYYTGEKNWKTLLKKESSKNKSEKKESHDETAKKEKLDEKLDISFFKNITIDDDEKAFVEGLKAFIKEDELHALEIFNQELKFPDAAFMAGFIALKNKLFADAIKAFKMANEKQEQLGNTFKKYDIELHLVMPITEEILAYMKPTQIGTLLGLVEAYQGLKEFDNAIEILKTLRELDNQDLVIKISLAELYLDSDPTNKIYSDKIVKMSSKIENESPIHTALLLYKAKALRVLDKTEESKNLLTKILRKKKDRSQELLCAIRYERALTYKDLNKKGQAKKEFTKLYEECPEYEDRNTGISS